MSFSNVLEAILFWVFRWVYPKILRVVHGGAPKMIPTMKNSVLMEGATALAHRIRTQKVTSVEVVRAYADRIREINGVLNCVVDERFEQALKEAKEVDEMIRSRAKTTEELEKETPFLGVPFSVPESVAVKGLSNTTGVWSCKGTKAQADAELVSLMREGGAIPFACTNVSESCLTRETNNPVFGRTDNPYDTNRSVGGPFGGEACLIASSGSPLGAAPSPILPATFNGVFAHRPSANSCCGSAGPISRSSADLLPTLVLLSRRSAVELRLDQPVDLRRLRYYFAEGCGGRPVNEEIRKVVRKAVEHVQTFHKTSVERLDLERTIEDFLSCEANANAFGIRKTAIGKTGKVNLRKELVKASFGKSRHTLAFLITALAEEEMPSRKPLHFEKIKENRTRLFARFQELLGSDGVLLCPIWPTAALRHNESIAVGFSPGRGDVFEVLGLPATHCPAGLDSRGLPVGFQVVAATNQDRLTVAVAREMDRVFGGWKPPPTSGSFTLKNTIFQSLSHEKIKTL